MSGVDDGMSLRSWKNWADTLLENTYGLYLAGRDPRVPIVAKIIVVIVVAYALSPIDLVPDFIPVVGYLDDLLLLPLGIWVAVRLIPDEIWLECRLRAKRTQIDMRSNRAAAMVIVLVWVIVALTVSVWLYESLLH